jgi:hypothetical protein
LDTLLAFTVFSRDGRGGTGLGGALATFFAAGFAAGFEKAGASALLVGPGFFSDNAAARILAVSRCTFFFAVPTGADFAAGGFLLGTDLFDGFVATGLGGLGLKPDLAAANFSATDIFLPSAGGVSVAELLSPAPPLAARNLSATDIFLPSAGGVSVAELLSPAPPLAARNLSATDIFPTSDDSGCVLAGSAELLAGLTSALAAANMSATDIFFFSAIKHLHPN